MTPQIITMTQDEWLKEGRARFGADFMNWKFVCPGCGNVAAVSDYQPFKAAGADPNSATNQCIGRFLAGRSWLHGSGPGPCDYAGFGLIRISPVRVLIPETFEVHCFAFADASQ